MTKSAPKPYAEVIGDPISQSKSPLIHRFWLEQIGIDASYLAHRVSPSELQEYLRQRRQDPNWRGCNVTMPLKLSIPPLLDAIEPHAKAIGAVNTVYRGESGDLIGTNTDVEGFLEPLSDVLASQHLFRMARIVGTGGAARAIIAGLAQHGFTLVVAGRNPSKARALLDELAPEGEHYTAPLDHFAEQTDFAFHDREGCLDLVVNASPLGMTGQPPLTFDMSHAPPSSIVYDIVTDPEETPFLRAAEDSDFRTIGGMAMLVGQAATAFERLFGQKPPRDLDGELYEKLRA
ncbi:MAG: shikimate dehydrogenase [Pseudomonadota bacterium]